MGHYLAYHSILSSRWRLERVFWGVITKWSNKKRELSKPPYLTINILL
jgi:hypothetical protein